MKTKKRKSCSAPAQMGGKGQRISNCVCYLCFFRVVYWRLAPYIGIYRLMDAFLTDTCSIQVISENAVLDYARRSLSGKYFKDLSGSFFS